MNNLKVGDKRNWKATGSEFDILLLGKQSAFCKYSSNEEEWSCAIEHILKDSTPYQEPVPVKRIVGFVSEYGDVLLSIEDSQADKDNKNGDMWERIELSPEMLWGAK